MFLYVKAKTINYAMHTFHYNNTRIRDRVKSRLMQYREDDVLRDNREKMELLQQAALVCKLFKKKVCITWLDEIGCRQATASVYLVTPRTVVLREGRFIPLHKITSINVI